jgi:hypothetical protein
MNGIGISKLHQIAAEYDRPPSAVSRAVINGLIHKAVRQRSGKGTGTVFMYPPGTDKTLRNVFELQRMGIKGATLRFGLWSEGLAPYSKWVSEYCTDVMEWPAKAIRFHITRTLNKTSELRGDEFSIEDEFIQKYDELVMTVITDELMNVFIKTLGEIDPNSMIAVVILERVLKITMADITNIFPSQFTAPAFPPVAAFIMGVKGLPENAYLHKDGYLFEEIINGLKFNEWFKRFIKYAKSADSIDYDIALQRVLENDFLLKAIKIVLAPLYKSTGDTLEREHTPWEIRKLGPWIHPRAAALAMAVGMFVGLEKWVQAKNENSDLTD